MTVASQTSSPKGIQPQNYVVVTEQPPGNQTVLKRKQTILYLHLDFENILTVDALVDSRAYVSTNGQNDLDTTKQKASKNNLKNGGLPNFQRQVANGSLGKPLATATTKSESGDILFAAHSVVLKKITEEPILGLHFMRNNSVVNDTPHGLIFSPT